MCLCSYAVFGWCRYALQRVEEALQDYRRVLEVEPRNETALHKVEELQASVTDSYTGERPVKGP